MSQVSSPKPAGWLTTIVLFGIPALIFFWLFHWLGPRLLQQGASWWIIFQCLLVAPLGCMLVAPFVLLRIKYGSRDWTSWKVRLRLMRPQSSGRFWAAALSAFMYGGNWQDAVALIAAWIALWKEEAKEKWLYAAVPAFILLKRNLGVISPVATSVHFFNSAFNREFFNHFGPTDFMGIQLAGAWWLVIYYVAWLIILNIFGEELGGGVMYYRGRSFSLVAQLGWFMASFGRCSTCSSSLLCSTQHEWPLPEWRSLLLHSERRILGLESSAIASRTCRC